MRPLLTLLTLLLSTHLVFAQSRFLSLVEQKLSYVPSKSDEISYRLLSEYGSLWLNSDPRVVLPPAVVFASASSCRQFQSSLKLAQLTLSPSCKLQEPALKALQRARDKATSKGLSVTPRGTDSCLRNYEMTQKLWLSRVEPNLAYYVQNGKISKEWATQVKALPTWQQVKAVLALEENGLSFDKYRQGSIVNSVAPPGSSQHLSGLAFDLAEYSNPKVRVIMNEFGWFQTVQNDLPHFTYLGIHTESELAQMGLRKIQKNGFDFWIPNI